MPFQNYEAETFADLREMYRAVMTRHGSKSLFLQKRGDGFEAISYRRFVSDVEALGEALFAKGFCGEHIAVIGENCEYWARAVLAISCGVGVVVPIDKDFSAETIASILQMTDVETVIVSPSCRAKVDACHASVSVIDFSELDEMTAEGRRLIHLGQSEYRDRSIDPNETCALFLTLDDVGKHRAVMVSHRNLCFNLAEICRMVEVLENDIFFSVLPMHHIYEYVCGFLCPMLRGCTVAFSTGFAHMIEEMRAVHPTVMLGVPQMLDLIHRKIWAHIRRQDLETEVRMAIKTTGAMQDEKKRLAARRGVFAQIHRIFGGSLRLLISGGGVPNPETASGLRALGIAVLQGYGMTECASIAALNRDTFYRDGAMGLVTPNAFLDIFDEQEDGIGEICVRGDQITAGYYHDEGLTRERFRDGWFYTGDLGYFDQDGFLYVVGRKKNAIISASGLMIIPEELEARLRKFPCVQECAVIGVSFETEVRPIALVYPDGDSLSRLSTSESPEVQVKQEIRRAIAEVNAAVAPHKHIFDFLLLDAPLPKGSARKLYRVGLTERYAAEYRSRQKNS